MILLLTALATHGSASRSAAAEADAPAQPNIIFIMVDDMARDWIGCYGAAHQTPNVDRLAQEGVRFTTAWCAPICTPTRVELLTGLYPFRTGWTDHHDVPRWGGAGLDPDRYTTWARVARDAGYATAIGGKWQINDFRVQQDALKRHGFDEHCMWTGYETGNPPSGERYWDAFIQTNGDRRTYTGRFGPDVINEFLVDFIERSKDRPFLVYYPMVLVHGPYVATPDNRSSNPTGSAELYAGMVSYMDRLVGNIVAAVDKAGLTDRTAIIFTGDNGSSVGGNLNGQPFPGGKGQIADRGMHVPLIVRAPWLARGGTASDDLVDFTDVFPTIVELSGGTPPAGVPLDGRSIVPLLRGAASAAEKRQWIFAQRAGNRTVRDQRFKLDSSGAFWDLAADPLEKDDLRSSTDPEIAAARERLSAVLSAMPADGPAPFEGFQKVADRGRRAGAD